MAVIFFLNDPATPEIYTLSLHDALPISLSTVLYRPSGAGLRKSPTPPRTRSEEHTSELQSHSDLVCRLLLEKKNQHNCRRNTGSALPLHSAWRPTSDKPQRHRDVRTTRR